MAERITLRYRNRDVVFKKSEKLIAVRARAGMATAMQADINKLAGSSSRGRAVGAFEVIELRPSANGLEQDLDWLRARPSVAAASHVFMIQGKTTPMVPDGHVLLHFDPSVSGNDQQTVLTRYRLQPIEQRGDGEYLVRITPGSRNPLATAAALQTEPGISLAEPEFAGAS